MNGIFGFKCSPNIVSTKGTTYRTGEEGPTMVVAGPMARYMDDVISGFKVLIGKDETEKLKLNDDVDVKRINFFYSLEIKDPAVSQIRDTIKDCVLRYIYMCKTNEFNKLKCFLCRAVKYLNEYTGKDAQLVDFENTKYATKLFSYQLRQENHGNVDFSKDIASRERSVCVYAN